MHTPCPPGVYILAGERDIKALTSLFYFVVILVTARERHWVSGKHVSEGPQGRREVWEEMSVQLVASPPVAQSSSLPQVAWAFLGGGGAGGFYNKALT